MKIIAAFPKTGAAPQSANADLKSLSVTGASIAFNPAILAYNVSVPNATASVTITAAAADAKSAVAGTGVKPLALGLNRFEITVTAENKAAKKYTVNVTRLAPVYPNVTAVKSAFTAISIAAKKKVDLKKLVGLYTTGNKPIKDTLTWTSSKPAVAAVKNGVVTAGKKPGKVVITIKARNGKSLKINITVAKKAAKLKKLTGKVPAIKVGKPNFITLKGTGTNITSVKWKVTGKGLKIDKFGMATATKKGKFTITATAGGKKFTKKITVK
jgi:hypothetical protein